MKFTLSNPPSGLALYYDAGTSAALKTFLDKAGGRLTLATAAVNRSTGDIEFFFRMGAEGKSEKPNSEKATKPFRVSFGGCRSVEQVLSDAEIGWFHLSDGTGRIHQGSGGATGLVIVVPAATYAARRYQQKNVGTEREPKPVSAPVPQTVMVLLSVAGEELSFNVPMGEVFKQSLEWTRKGYAA